MNYQFKCQRCSKLLKTNEVNDFCTCGGIIDFEFHAQNQLDIPDQKYLNFWRYGRWLPLSNLDDIVSLGESITGCISVTHNNCKVWLKQDHLMPSGSFKDRGAAVMISAIKERNIQDIVIDSSGNAASAVSSYAAKAGIQCHVFVPKHIPNEKIIQIACSGAEINVINGNRDDTAKAARKAGSNMYYASHYMNPFFISGMMTLAFELFDQFDEKLPPIIILPVGNGSLIIGMYKGFLLLKESGKLKEIPQLIAVQSENISPVYDRFFNNSESNCSSVPKIETLADGIAIGQPTRMKDILESLHSTKGDVITVSDFDVRNAMRWLHHHGFYVEPTGAVGFAGALRLSKFKKMNKDILTILTGHGLKATSKLSAGLSRNVKSD